MKNLARTIIASVIVGSLLAALPSWSLELEMYAPNSKLATGRWCKVCVKTTGMQFLSNAQLKSLGFSDPAKVNVYGYGGQMQPEPLEPSIYVDDLPQQPVIRVPGGLVFFGVNNEKWIAQAGKEVPFLHINSPYAKESFYFLSDIEMPEKEMPVLRYDTVNHGRRQDYFIERAFHEQELAAPSDLGTWMFGEDFKDNLSQDFVLKLPGLVADRAPSGIKYGFGVKSQGKNTEDGMPKCRLKVSTNGVELPFLGYIHTGDLLPTVTNTEEGFIRATNCGKVLPNPAEEVTVNVTLEPEGAVQFARLDYIMISYPRKLELSGDEPLLFSGYRTVFDTVTYVIEGCTEKTQIWDVTNPAFPARVAFTLDGTRARFTPMRTLYREYIVFDPEKVTLAPASAGNVPNQDLHSQPVPDMVIITPPEFRQQAERLAEFHRSHDNMDVFVVEPQTLYNEFSSGSPDLMAYRKALKMWYDRGLNGDVTSKLSYCLLFGRSYFDMREITPGSKTRGYPFLLMYQSPDPSIRPLVNESESQDSYTTQYSSDDFIAALDDNSRSFVFDQSVPDARIAVGRMPVKTVKEAKEMVDKIIRYVETPQTGIASNQVLIIADDGDQGSHLTQAEIMYKNMVANATGAGFQYEKLYMDVYQADPTPQGLQHTAARQRNLALLDQGVAYWLYTGHGNQRELTHEAFFTYQDVIGLKNKFIPLMYTATCDYSPVDRATISAGELIWLHPEAGSICMFTTTRGVWISHNRYMNEEFSKKLLSRDAQGRPLPIGHIIRQAKNSVRGFDGGISRRNTQIYRFLLLGDPALRIPLPEYQVKVETFGDRQVEASDYEAPTLQGNSRVAISGTVTDLKGKVATGFSGELHVVLFDSERTVRAVTNKDDGQVNFFNSYSNILFKSVVKVEKGKWSTELLIPSEIENNYSKALINFYAVTPKGRYANGKFDDFYIYGLSDEGSDREGPQITGFTLNTPDFKEGDVVGMQAVVYATMSDKSGINISSQGIGHQIALSLDGKSHFMDVANYYSPVVNDIYSGSIVYPLSDLTPGDHTLALTVWDNANNSSTAELKFRVTADPRPQIYDVRTDANPATTSVTFTVMHDRMLEDAECEISVYDLTGRRLWSGKIGGNDDLKAGTSMKWNLTDGSGQRVPRGIYLYRAVLTGSNGVSVSKTKKLAVTAQ